MISQIAPKKPTRVPIPILFSCLSDFLSDFGRLNFLAERADFVLGSIKRDAISNLFDI